MKAAEQHLPVTAVPFDAVADRYDAEFTGHPLGRLHRTATWRYLEQAFQPGDHVLDLGCGTGEDALRLAERAVNVYGVDSSGRMVAVARDRASRHAQGGRVSFAQADLASLTAEDVLPAASGLIDGAYSNFGALNCLPDRSALAEVLASCVRNDGRLVLVLMSRFCPWEWIWFGARGRFGTAFRRLRDGRTASVGGGSVKVWYPSPRRIRKEFAPWFRQVSLAGIGVCLPPTFASAVVDERPGTLRRLAHLDEHLGRRFPGTWLNDHYVVTLRRTGASAPPAPRSSRSSAS